MKYFIKEFLLLSIITIITIMSTFIVCFLIELVFNCFKYFLK